MILVKSWARQETYDTDAMRHKGRARQVMEKGRNNPGRGDEQSAEINLEVNPDDVARLIQLARDFHAEDAVILPDEPAGPDWQAVGSALAEYSGNPVLEEFRSIINDLDQAQQAQVVALMWLGRGDYEPEEWEILLEDAEDAWSDHTADYLLAHPLLAEQLEEGLESLGYFEE